MAEGPDGTVYFGNQGSNLMRYRKGKVTSTLPAVSSQHPSGGDGVTAVSVSAQGNVVWESQYPENSLFNNNDLTECGADAQAHFCYGYEAFIGISPNFFSDSVAAVDDGGYFVAGSLWDALYYSYYEPNEWAWADSELTSADAPFEVNARYLLVAANQEGTSVWLLREQCPILPNPQQVPTCAPPFSIIHAGKVNSPIVVVPNNDSVEAFAVDFKGDLWFTDTSSNSIGHETQAGKVTYYQIPRGHSANELTVGPDGAIWFTDDAATEIGRMSTSGKITEYDVPTKGVSFTTITAPPGANCQSRAIWFGETGPNGRTALAEITS